jgi:excisionase family DNA binding protein
MPDLLTVQDLVRKFKIPEQSVYRMVREGRLSPVRIGRRLRFTEDEAQRLIACPTAPGGKAA